MGATYKCDETDKYLGERELQGEGTWFMAYCFETLLGEYYEVWVDQDGEEKVMYA
jgi:hypothetical protein